jgi:hypothetical protein
LIPDKFLMDKDNAVLSSITSSMAFHSTTMAAVAPDGLA